MPARRLAVLTAALLATGALRAEPPAVEDIRRTVDGNVESAISLYREFLSLPNARGPMGSDGRMIDGRGTNCRRFQYGIRPMQISCGYRN